MNRATLAALLVLGALPATGKVGRFSDRRLNIADWTGIRAEYERCRHAVFPAAGGHEARNFRQHWLTHFDGRGFAVEPDQGEWRWGLELSGLTGKATVAVEANRIAYRWSPDLEEWFVNDARGLEHGFTLKAPHELRLTVRGGLRAEASEDGLVFLDAGGVARVTYSGLRAWDANGKALPARMEAGGETISLRVDDRGARYPITVDPIAQQAYLKASNADSPDVFGHSVAISGDTAVVGAPFEASNATGVNGNQANNTANRSGAAYVFVRTSGVWTQQAYLKASNTEAFDQFGGAVSISGNTIAVGAASDFLLSGAGEDSGSRGVNGDQNNNDAPGSGAVYVFVRNGTTWSQQAYLKASNTGAGDAFGSSVAVDGDTIAVGAPLEASSATGVNGDQNNDSTYQAGAAYVFVRTGATWEQQAYLKASNTGPGDSFGRSLALSGDTLAIGSHRESSNATGVNGNQNDDSAVNSGAAYVFVRSGAVWTQQAYLKASNTGAGDFFGWSVGVSGDTAVIGALGEDSSATGVNGNQANDNASDSGAAYVFVRSGNVWVQQAYLKATNTGPADNFGWSVAVSGNTILVGAYAEDSAATGLDGPQADNNAPDSGAAYVLVRGAGGIWTPQAYLKASNTGSLDIFGFSVAASGDTLLVGGYGEDSATRGINGDGSNNFALESGAAYAFAGFANFTTVTIASSPAALVFTSQGAGCAPGTYVAPQTLAWVAGASCTIAFAAVQSGPSPSPAVRYVFSRWEDNSTNSSRTIVAPVFPVVYTASFDTQYLLTTQVTGSGTVTPPTGFFNSGSVVALTAVPSQGTFVNWTGPVANANSPATTVTMTAPRTVTANFTTVTLRSGPGIFRAGFFWLEDVDNNRQFNIPPDRAFAFGGISGDIPLSGDWSGSGTSKVGIYRPLNGQFILDYDGDGQFTAADKVYVLGVGTDPADIPVVGDWNGTGTAKVGLYRMGLWILDTNGDGTFAAGADQALAFGGSGGDIPVPGDWDGNGRTDPGIFRQGYFWILDQNGNGAIDNVNGTGGDKAFGFGGLAGDVPVAGDWNGDGRTKVGIFRAGFFWVLDANGNNLFEGTGAGQDLAFAFGGIAGDKPVAGKW